MKWIKAFRVAYNKKENHDIQEEWQATVMRHILRLGPLKSKTDYIMLFDNFVWRFAAVACVIAVILSVYLFQTGFQPEYEIAELFLNNPIEFTFIQDFGI